MRFAPLQLLFIMFICYVHLCTGITYGFHRIKFRKTAAETRKKLAQNLYTAANNYEQYALTVFAFAVLLLFSFRCTYTKHI